MRPLEQSPRSTGPGIISPNALVFRVLRTGYVYFFDGDIAILIARPDPSISQHYEPPQLGRFLTRFHQKKELVEILQQWRIGSTDRYMLDNSDTVIILAAITI